MKLYFYIAQFFIAIFVVLLYYKFVETKGIKKYTKNNLPVDLKLLIKTQKIDVKKISYAKLMRVVSIVNAVDIGIVLLITNITENILLKFVIAIPLIFGMLFLSYSGIGLILKRKGMTKNES